LDALRAWLAFGLKSLKAEEKEACPVFLVVEF
jgi:hypothetical protein